MAAQPFPFLSLPTEVRIQIYGYFLTFPASKSGGSKETAQERTEIVNTRYSLQRVCRQINTEWSPLFYATTTVVATGVLRKDDSQREQTQKAGFTPQRFEILFCTNYRRHITETVKWISYDASTDSSSGKNTAITKVHYLYSALSRNIDSFKCLEKITFLSKLTFLESVPLDAVHQTTQGTKLQKVWEEAMGYDAVGPWKEIRVPCELSGKRDGLSDWIGVRRMHFGECPNCVSGKNHIDEVQMIFRKPGSPQLEDTEGWVESRGI
ncbi:hypothetical protein H2200_011628 [Cladophialophora chaetospira]|uniref:F-box domain-containing protein n=1 Tax=Cladophialophora chaetospira TaxID=386627 RepID=A0AA38WZP6_9EURO|nr:hypothetical protein H2200_011628 [Cladophialophora chaetospira]